MCGLKEERKRKAARKIRREKSSNNWHVRGRVRPALYFSDLPAPRIEMEAVADHHCESYTKRRRSIESTGNEKEGRAGKGPGGG